MKQFEEVFLEILKAGMWGVRPQVPEEFDDWGSVVRLAKSQSVLGIVGDVLLSDAELSQRIPIELKDKVKKFVMANMVTHSLLNNTLVKVVSALRDNGVESVLLKGQGIARNYPRPELRQCGDIDLYVGIGKEEVVHDILAPIAMKIDGKDCLYINKHFHVTMAGGVEVEVHRYTDNHLTEKLETIYQDASDKGVTENLVVYDFLGTPVNTPADNFNAFYIFNHLFHHFITSGIGLRQFCDWMIFLHKHKGDIKLDYLEQLLNDMNLMMPWKAFGCVLVKMLGMPQGDFPFYDSHQERKAKRIIKRVLKEGNFGKERAMIKNRGSVYMANKIRSLFSHIFKAFSLLFLFPKQIIVQFGSTMAMGFSIVWTDVKDKFKGSSRVEV